MRDRNRLLTIMMAIMAMLALLGHAYADPVLSQTEEAVARDMHAKWPTNRPPLQLLIIVVQEDAAIADWLSGSKGGRTLLRKRKGEWHAVLYGGGELVFAYRLQRAGVNTGVAETLSQMLRGNEQTLTPAQKEKIDQFQGLIDFSDNTEPAALSN